MDTTRADIDSETYEWLTQRYPYATLDAAGIPRHVLGERFAAVCERLEDTAPAWASESDIYRKAGFYLDDRGSLDWEDEDMCELPGTEMARATDAKARTFEMLMLEYADSIGEPARAVPTAALNGDLVESAMLAMDAYMDRNPNAAHEDYVRAALEAVWPKQPNAGNNRGSPQGEPQVD